ncbi:hypothetical protein CASFOL_026029 [Castilleja foliolosa]|uniref:Uncharacterized protein n=1 Tax=Castilleja foliolosa TaxID=1961234 RepID=A0ABD3CSS7_9LAMI
MGYKEVPSFESISLENEAHGAGDLTKPSKFVNHG